MAEVLQDNGYFTCMSGKWHLGYQDTYGPHNRGFTKSFTMLAGGGNHWGYEPDWAAHEPDGKRPKKFIAGQSPRLYCKNGHKWVP